MNIPMLAKMMSPFARMRINIRNPRTSHLLLENELVNKGRNDHLNWVLRPLFCPPIIPMITIKINSSKVKFPYFYYLLLGSISVPVDFVVSIFFAHQYELLYSSYTLRLSMLSYTDILIDLFPRTNYNFREQLHQLIAKEYVDI